jgi:CDP-glucose 4,6-dehydratase
MERGHQVSGISLNPESNSLFQKANIGNLLNHDIRCDIRDLEDLERQFNRIKPDIVIHLAAQALVRQSYEHPISTFETNVIGTINVLKASQSVSGLKAQLIITTDKVYRNQKKISGYSESEPLGGRDPYSASKAMADIATQSWLSSFVNVPTAIARAGNVIGGGDVCADRLIPDLINSYVSRLTPRLRAPNSVRPWQHVLDCLNGYLLLLDAVVIGNAEGAWNFGPLQSQSRTVADVANIAGRLWGVEENWVYDEGDHPHETDLLVLNSEKARIDLGWMEKLTFEENIEWTINWYKAVHNGANPLAQTLKNIRDFESL